MVQSSPPSLITPKQRAYIVALCGKLQIDPEIERDILRDDITQGKAGRFIRRLERRLKVGGNNG